MMDEEDEALRPLPVVLRPVPDELLSSWLARHATYYGVSGPFFAKWLKLGTSNLHALDHRLGVAQVARLSERLRCDPRALIAMTFIELPARSAELVCRGRLPQICLACADRHAGEGASGAVPKHWRLAWRITCPACGALFLGHNRTSALQRDVARHEPLRSSVARSLGRRSYRREFPSRRRHVRILADRAHASSASADLAAIQRECRAPGVGWALGIVIPEFDDFARPIKRRINHSAVATLPISFRPALLAGVSRVLADPALLEAIRDETILRARRAFERLCATARQDAQEPRKSHQM